MNYRDCLKQGEVSLFAAGIEEAAQDAWLLFSEVFQMSKASYYMVMNQTCDADRAMQYEKWIQRRSTRIPLQQITGSAPFMTYEFAVNEHVLIPRADTEVLVEETFQTMQEMARHLESISQPIESKQKTEKISQPIESEQKLEPMETRQKSVPSLRILDMCTGSGCIAVSLACMAKEQKIPCQIMAVDLSEDALQVAEKNNQTLCQGNVQMIRSNLFESLPDTKEFDIIVSNPPYIKSAEIEELMPEVRDHEPRMALDGTEDGLYFYRKLAEDGWRFLRNGGRLLLEIGCDQGESVPGILKACGYTQVQVLKDLAGLDRVVTAYKENR